jgi:uncharacterized phage infection (PIP) family protein YhgE
MLLQEMGNEKITPIDLSDAIKEIYTALEENKRNSRDVTLKKLHEMRKEYSGMFTVVERHYYQLFESTGKGKGPEGKPGETDLPELLANALAYRRTWLASKTRPERDQMEKGARRVVRRTGDLLDNIEKEQKEKLLQISKELMSRVKKAEEDHKKTEEDNIDLQRALKDSLREISNLKRENTNLKREIGEKVLGMPKDDKERTAGEELEKKTRRCITGKSCSKRKIGTKSARYV